MNNKLYNVIALCGIDGSGKTLQIKMLSNYFERRNLKYKVVWFRWQAFISYFVLGLSLMLGFTSKKNNFIEHKFYYNKIIAKLWIVTFTIDTFIYSILKIKIQNFLGYTVLMDRFIPDILVDLLVETKNYFLNEYFILKLLLSIIPKNSKLILLDVSEDIAYKRKDDIPNLDYLRKRRRFYLVIAKSIHMHVINAENDVFYVYKEILKRLIK